MIDWLRSLFSISNGETERSQPEPANVQCDHGDWAFEVITNEGLVWDRAIFINGYIVVPQMREGYFYCTDCGESHWQVHGESHPDIREETELDWLALDVAFSIEPTMDIEEAVEIYTETNPKPEPTRTILNKSD